MLTLRALPSFPHTDISAGSVYTSADATDKDTRGTWAATLRQYVHEWLAFTASPRGSRLQPRHANALNVGDRVSSRQTVNLHPDFSPLNLHAEKAYSLALCVMRDVVSRIVESPPYDVWGLALLYSHAGARRQVLHSDFPDTCAGRPSPSRGGISIVVSLDELGSLWVHADGLTKEVPMPKCGDYVAFGAGTLHAGAEYKAFAYPSGHWRLVCYAVPCDVVCNGFAMLPPGLCATRK